VSKTTTAQAHKLLDYLLSAPCSAACQSGLTPFTEGAGRPRDSVPILSCPSRKVGNTNPLQPVTLKL